MIEKVYCACGCGELRPMYDKRGSKRFYIIGHSSNNKVPWNKGTKGVCKPNSGSFKKGIVPWCKGLTKETDERVRIIAEKYPKNRKSPSYSKKELSRRKKRWKGNKNPMKKLENRLKVSISLKGKKKTEEHKKKLRGRITSQERKDEISKFMKGRYVGDKNYFYGKSFSGKLHPQWKGGISFEPYTIDFNDKFKEFIRERDNYTCKLCNIFEEDNLKIHNHKLSIHHVDYIKLNTFPQNCIALCIRCNALVNKDREIWTKHFQELLKKLYNYQYTQDQKIILDFTEVKDGTI